MNKNDFRKIVPQCQKKYHWSSPQILSYLSSLHIIIEMVILRTPKFFHPETVKKLKKTRKNFSTKLLRIIGKSHCAEKSKVKNLCSQNVFFLLKTKRAPRLKKLKRFFRLSIFSVVKGNLLRV